MLQNNSINRYAAFKKKHPKLHIANAFLSMFLPFCIVGLLMAIFEVIDGREALGVYAMVGSFVLGGGLLLCVMVDYDEEVFWRLNVYPTIIGFLVTFGNLFLACTNIPGIEFDEARLDFQLCCYLSAFNCLISYAASREAISDCILAHTGLSKEQLEDRTEGLLNKLWYRRIHQESGAGWIYYFNAFFTVVLFLYSIGKVILVFSKTIANIVMALGLLAALLSIILQLFVVAMAAKNKKSYHKTRKKLLGRIPFFSEISCVVSILVLVWLQIEYFIAL